MRWFRDYGQYGQYMASHQAKSSTCGNEINIIRIMYWMLRHDNNTVQILARARTHTYPRDRFEIVNEKRLIRQMETYPSIQYFISLSSRSYSALLLAFMQSHAHTRTHTRIIIGLLINTLGIEMDSRLFVIRWGFIRFSFGFFLSVFTSALSSRCCCCCCAFCFIVYFAIGGKN